MQNETASTAFLKYGSVYRHLPQPEVETFTTQLRRIPAQQTLSHFLHFSCDVYIEVHNGIGILLVANEPVATAIEEFGLNHRVHINPNVYFGFISTTPELIVKIHTQPDYQMDAFSLSTPYEYRPILPRVQIENIIGYYYRIRTPDYHFAGEKHSFFELTYVDTGILYTEVDGVQYTVGEKELIIYGPGQFHTQQTGNQAASYVTIMFNMENTSLALPSDWYNVLINQVFPYNKKIYTLVKTLVQESSNSAPYTDCLMHCLLTETILRLLQGVYASPSMQPSGVVRQNYQDELFDQIIAYIESKIYEPLSVANICQHFSISRSTLQLLFKNTVNQSPKKYISDLKLEKSCWMLRENKYTISEISLKLGYSSIHYFSNAFNQKYHISPSEYAKRIY